MTNRSEEEAEVERVLRKERQPRKDKRDPYGFGRRHFSRLGNPDE